MTLDLEAIESKVEVDYYRDKISSDTMQCIIRPLLARVRELEDRMERAIECLEDTKSREQNLDIAAMHILKDGLT